ncbi:DASH family cryptochrome [Vibrio aquimaris]|uniref:Cryptochrome DASH n=1 Tax=Vibrio aquimaris TaxID=2587862 RepID=A0A5P9CQK9_9VIBR|nr:DASH family cryptochrome [Vibrio aquimaris]QFT28545.1 Cryptochrome DASH [Vibrio aquimaris]
MSEKIGLYWFHCDLRVQDNDLLFKASREVDRLICFYCFPSVDQYLCQYSQERQLGEQRQAFLSQSVASLSQTLGSLGQKLIVQHGEAFDILSDFIKQYRVTHFYCDLFSGSNEQSTVESLSRLYSRLICTQLPVNNLFSEALLPFPLEELPNTFTQFRKKVEHLPIGLTPKLSDLPPIVAGYMDSNAFESIPCEQFPGGEQEGLTHCEYYFSGHLAKQYKQTRNGLDGVEFSTKFSPWLALGCVSPKRIFTLLKEFESKQGANDSTYWIFFELLWREYFRWYARKWRARLFHFSGINRQTPLTSFYSYRFQQWKQGETQFPIVNACMKQMKATGYMSNRGRQLVASCLIHELELDWRYGAAYFETQLIDYDVASNWGNWQYLAGVGADPRGSRQFNLDKQTQMYDPDETFINKWQGKAVTRQLDQVDMVDWPIEPAKGDN